MSELVINLKGEITDTNFDEWKSNLLKQLKGVNTELASDDDFANAEIDVKTIKNGEKTLKQAKASALEQANEIQTLFAAIDEVSEEARQARLKLEKQIKIRKAEIKDQIEDTGFASIKDYLEEQSETLQSTNHNWLDRSAFDDATKGKRTTASMTKSVAQLVSKIKDEIAASSDAIAQNEQLVNDIDQKYSALFQDKNTLLTLPGDELQETIKERIEFFEAESKKQQAATVEPPATVEKPAEVEAEADATNFAANSTETIHPADESHVISIEVFSPIDSAQELYDEIDNRYSNREIVGEIKLS